MSFFRVLLVSTWVVALHSLSAVQAADRTAAPKKKVSANAVSLRVSSWNGVQKLVRSHKGKLVVVNIWTTTCAVCVEELPKFVRLQKEYGKKKLACISVNCDYDGIKDKPPKFYRQDVVALLKKNGATFENLMLNIAFIDFLEQIDLGSTPSLLVYGRDGKLVKRFDNDDAEKIEDEFSIKDVKQLIEKLLEQR